tara:strand:- start:342 stop:698 length:357 start_codon:yes stop_codon:yes gene_type:complete
MKKLLILIVAGALYFHFYPNEKLNSWLLAQKTVALSYFSDATDTSVRLSSKKVYQDLSGDFAQFSSKEQAYVAEITASREEIINFYQLYCLKKKQAPKLHRDNLTKVCQVIGNYSKFF